MGCQGKNAMKSLGASDSRCCCQSEILWWAVSPKNYEVKALSGVCSDWSNLHLFDAPYSSEPSCGDGSAVMRYAVLFCLRWYMIISPRFLTVCAVRSGVPVIFSYTVPTARVHNDSLVLFSRVMHRSCCLRCIKYIPTLQCENLKWGGSITRETRAGNCCSWILSLSSLWNFLS